VRMRQPRGRRSHEDEAAARTKKAVRTRKPRGRVHENEEATRTQLPQGLRELFARNHFSADQHGQLGVDIPRLRAVEKEAEELEAQMMETRKRVLGQERPSTLTSMG
jgi:hypothetical protein